MTFSKEREKRWRRYIAPDYYDPKSPRGSGSKDGAVLIKNKKGKGEKRKKGRRKGREEGERERKKKKRKGKKRREREKKKKRKQEMGPARRGFTSGASSPS
jgi:hypothetical protein